MAPTPDWLQITTLANMCHSAGTSATARGLAVPVSVGLRSFCLTSCGAFLRRGAQASVDFLRGALHVRRRHVLRNSEVRRIVTRDVLEYLLQRGGTCEGTAQWNNAGYVPGYE